MIAYPDIYQCADHVPDVMAHKPIGLEGIDDLLVEYTRRKGINSEGLALLPRGGGWLLAEFGAATVAEAEAQARGLMDTLGRGQPVPDMRLFTDARADKRVWEVRESSLGAISHVPGEALQLGRLGRFRRCSGKTRRLLARPAEVDGRSFGYRGTLYGHFGHACVHTRINFDLESEEGIAKFRRFMEEAADLVVSYGGSLSGEHGDGQARAELLPKMFGPELRAGFPRIQSALGSRTGR